jgi:hypothetical protein
MINNLLKELWAFGSSSSEIVLSGCSFHSDIGFLVFSSFFNRLLAFGLDVE